MPKIISILSLTTMMAFGAAVAAQETTETTETTEAAESETAAEAPAAEEGATDAAGSDLAVGETAQDGPQLGQTYKREDVGDWELRCVRTETPENDPCQLYQLLREEDGNAVAEISLFRLPESSKLPAGATIIVPLETLLTGQLGISIDGSQPKSYPYSFCNRQGCYARIGLTAEDVAAFKRGNEANILIRPFAAPDQVVVSTMSLSGFTAGYDKASVIQQQ